MAYLSRTEDDLKTIWMEMFNATAVASCKNEEDEHLAKMSMLLKTVYWTQKCFQLETRRKHHSLSQALTIEKQRTEALEAELAQYRQLEVLHAEKKGHDSQLKIVSLSALHEEKEAQRFHQLTSEEVETKSVLAVHTSPGATSPPPPGQESGLKRLSAEGVNEQAEEGGVLKKAKVTSSPTTPKKGDGRVLCGKEALPEDTDLGPKTFFDSQNSLSEDLGPRTMFNSPDHGPKTFFDSERSPCKDLGPKTFFESPVGYPATVCASPKSPDLFSEQRPVLRDLDQSPRSSYSPATPKSPIIMTARSRKHLAENQENRSPSLTISQVVSEAASSPGKHPHAARPLHFASSPTIKPSPVKPNVTSTKLPSPCIPSPRKPVKSNALIKPLSFVPVPVKYSPKNNCVIEHNKSVVSNQSLTFENSRTTKSGKSKTVSTYLNGQSKLEFQPADKPVKSTKLKQSKLSLSMFQPKKSTVIPSTNLLDEDEQFLLALEESIKIHNQPQSLLEKTKAVDVNQTFHQGPLHSHASTTASHCQVLSDLGITPITSSAIEDEEATPPSAAAAEPEAGFSRPPPPLSSLEKEYLTSYDRVPEKPKAKPYVFTEPPERKKAARQLLPGWECHECKMFFDAYSKGMGEEERKQVVERCSKHRQAQPVICGTPPGLWDLNMLQSPLDETQYGALQLRNRTKPGQRLIDKATRVSPTPSCELDNF